MHTASIQESKQLSVDNLKDYKSSVDDLGDITVSSELTYACRSNITHRARPYEIACSRVCPAGLLCGLFVGSVRFTSSISRIARKCHREYLTRYFGQLLHIRSPENSFLSPVRSCNHSLRSARAYSASTSCTAPTSFWVSITSFSRAVKTVIYPKLRNISIKQRARSLVVEHSAGTPGCSERESIHLYTFPIPPFAPASITRPVFERRAFDSRRVHFFWTFLQSFCGLSTLKSCAHAARSTHTTQVTSAQDEEAVKRSLNAV